MPRYAMNCYDTSGARASRVTEVSRRGRTYKDKGEPIGTLAGTAIDCVIWAKSLSSRCANPRHLCLTMLQLIWLACDASEFLTSLFDDATVDRVCF